MIISPNALTTTNVLHAVNNAYKCTDEVYMFAQSEEDCHLYLQKLYWERDPEDDFVAPNFTLPMNNIMLLRDDLVDVDFESDLDITARQVPYRTYMQNGYGIGDELVQFAVLSSTDFTPVLRPQSSTRNQQLEEQSHPPQHAGSTAAPRYTTRSPVSSRVHQPDVRTSDIQQADIFHAEYQQFDLPVRSRRVRRLSRSPPGSHRRSGKPPCPNKMGIDG